MSTSIQISACDNELYVVASTPAGSSEVVHMSSGYNNPVAYNVTLNSILPSGTYNLTFVGINWGGPAAFNIAVTSGSTTTPYTYSNPNAATGLVWSQSVQVTI